MSETGEGKAKPKSQGVFPRALSSCSVATIVWKTLHKYSLSEIRSLEKTCSLPGISQIKFGGFFVYLFCNT